MQLKKKNLRWKLSLTSFILYLFGFFKSKKVKSNLASSGNKTSKASKDRGQEKLLPAALGDGLINSFVNLLVVVVLVPGVFPHVGLE